MYPCLPELMVHWGVQTFVDIITVKVCASNDKRTAVWKHTAGRPTHLCRQVSEMASKASEEEMLL